MSDRDHVIRMDRTTARSTPCNHAYPCARHASINNPYDGVFNHLVPAEPVQGDTHTWKVKYTIHGEVVFRGACGQDVLNLIATMSARELVMRGGIVDLDIDSAPERSDDSQG